MNSYNTQAIETLLRRAFDSSKLVMFCYDYYHQVYRKFTVHTTHDDRVEQLLAHCLLHQRVDELLQRVKRIAPQYYTQEKDYYQLPTATTNIQANEIKGFIQHNSGPVTMNFS